MNNQGANPTIIECIFVANTCSFRGGGVGNVTGDVTMERCVFAGNRAARFGGAVGNIRSEPVITNCTIVENRGGEAGGGVRCGYGSDALLKNSILWGNSAPVGAQIAVDGMVGDLAKITVEYNAVMGNEDAVYVEANARLEWGAGNIDSDPCFAEPGYWGDANDPNIIVDPNDPNSLWVDGEYHLKSQAGRWDPPSGDWVYDDVTSPCIDAGDPMSPIGLEPFPNGGIVNMGAYGGTSEASKSYFGTAPCETIVAGDVNGDCKVDFLDFQLMGWHWLEEH